MSGALTNFSERINQRYKTPESAPVDTFDRCVSIPNDPFYIRALTELMSLLGDADFWDDSDGGLSSEETAIIWTNTLTPLLADLCSSGGSGNVENLPITIWADEMDYSLASTPELTIAASQAYNFYVRTNATTNDEEISALFTCGTGVYTLKLLDVRRNDAGIVDVRIDGVLIGQYDPKTLTSYNYLTTFEGIDLDEGEHTLQLQSTTTSGTKYTQNHTKVWLEKTA